MTDETRTPPPNRNGNSPAIPDPTEDDYRRAWEVSVEVAKNLPPEVTARSEARFKRASDRAEAIVQGKIDPLSG